MITRLQRAWERATTSSAQPGLRFDRPLLLFQSDDWGRVGVRDREGWEQMRATGIHLGEAPYDFYCLETGEDLQAMRAVLGKHRDSSGRHPSMGMNFIMANVDFDRCLASSGKEISLVPLTEGLPCQWQRHGLFEAYRQGIQDGAFYAALHGLTHFCANSIKRELEADGERAELIRKLWRAQTPYIYWRMPWIGYEYWDGELEPERRFLSRDDQQSAIRRAAEIYHTFFGSLPFSACAPGYRANADTRKAWFEAGIRVVQNGPGECKAPYLDEDGMLHTFRTIEMEPATGGRDLANVLSDVEECFINGLPAVVSIHSLNFHSTIRDFRTPTLVLLDEFLRAIEKKWPDLLYLNDADLFRLATEGFYLAHDKKIDVGVRSMAA
ncbi:MAG: hypothetical protein WA172_07760 [Terriglobales bacterium]